MITVRRLAWSDGSHSCCVEDVGFYFAIVPLRRDFLAVQKKTYSSGIAGFHYDLAICANRRVRWRDKRFLVHRLAVSHDGDPGGFRGPDYYCERHGRVRALQCCMVACQMANGNIVIRRA